MDAGNVKIASPVGSQGDVTLKQTSQRSRVRLSCAETWERVDNYLKASFVLMAVDVALLAAQYAGAPISSNVTIGCMAMTAATGLWGVYRQSSGSQPK